MERQPPEDLADIARKDPKRAKRIITNRRSAMRAKLRRKLYVHALEINLHKLCMEKAALNSRMELLEMDSLYVGGDNLRLKECLENMEAKIESEDSSIEKVKKEIEALKKLLGPKKEKAENEDD